jgi:transposase-like protein
MHANTFGIQSVEALDRRITTLTIIAANKKNYTHLSVVKQRFKNSRILTVTFLISRYGHPTFNGTFRTSVA